VHPETVAYNRERWMRWRGFLFSFHFVPLAVPPRA